MYRSFFPRDMRAETDRLQRDMQQAFDLSVDHRGRVSRALYAWLISSIRSGRPWNDDDGLGNRTPMDGATEWLNVTC